MKAIKFPICHVFLLLFWFVSAFYPGSFCFAQNYMEPYILSELVQSVASELSIQEYKVLKELVQDYPQVMGSDRVVLYLDALTAADIIAKNRASLLQSERGAVKILREDVELSFSWFCFPFGPPHPKKRKLIDERKKVIENMYTDSKKRDVFEKYINQNLLRLPRDELLRRELNIFDILDIKSLIR